MWEAWVELKQSVTSFKSDVEYLRAQENKKKTPNWTTQYWYVYAHVCMCEEKGVNRTKQKQQVGSTNYNMEYKEDKLTLLCVLTTPFFVTIGEAAAARNPSLQWKQIRRIHELCRLRVSLSLGRERKKETWKNLSSQTATAYQAQCWSKKIPHFTCGARKVNEAVQVFATILLSLIKKKDLSLAPTAFFFFDLKGTRRDSQHTIRQVYLRTLLNVHKSLPYAPVKLTRSKTFVIQIWVCGGTAAILKKKKKRQQQLSESPQTHTWSPIYSNGLYVY